MSGLLGFLKSARVEEVPVTAKGAGGVRKERIPEGLAIRLFRDGSLYPSQALVDKFDLEYKTGTPVTEPVKNKAMDEIAAIPGAEVESAKTKTTFTFENGEGNGFDLIDSAQWHQFKAEGGRLIFVSPVPKSEPKVDLFGIVRRDEKTGVPTSTVLEQGSATKGEYMIQLVKEVYNIDLSKGEEDEAVPDFVDLVVTDVIEGFNVTKEFSQAISLFPKTVARGTDKGKPSYERRENAKVYALVPAAMLEAQEGKEAKTAPAGKLKSAEALTV